MPLYVGDNEIFGGDASNVQDTKVNNVEIKIQGTGFGSDSIAIGTESTISSNTQTLAVGANAHKNNEGVGNTAIGCRALQGDGNNPSLHGDWNTSVGLQAASGVTGDGNTVVGSEAWGAGTLSAAIASGQYNTVVGRKAGYLLNTGSNNVLIGFQAGTGANTIAGSLKTGSNNILIGTNSLDISDPINNQIILGDVNTTDLFCSATTIQFLSDKRDKKDIKVISAGLNLVKDLKPVEFVWNHRDENFERNGSKDCGFIAQDLKMVQEKYNLSEELKLVKEGVVSDTMHAAPARLLPILVKAIQELSAEVEKLKA
jgi:hypothetical protein